MDARHYDPLDRPACWVWHDHQFPPGWYAGHVHSWYRTPGGWRAVVRYECAVGLQFHHDVDAAWVRRAEDGPGADEGPIAPGVTS